MKRTLVPGVLSAVLPLILSVALGADTPMGSAFTYQGRLTNAGSPANGALDMKFTLFDAPTGGTLLATTTIPAVQVTNGLFTAKLEFGPLPYPAGAARWLEIQVSPPGGPILAPRQELTPQPFALFSSYTDPAHLTSLNAANITSGTVPSAAVSGTYANAMTLSSSGNVFVGDGSGLTNLNAQPKYARTVVVSPLASTTASGTALLAALANITTATATNRWLLKVEPGVYDLGTASLVMKPFVDVEGSGELATRIRGAGHATNDIGTVQVVANTELRFVSVENTGGAAYAKAVYVSGASPLITHVSALSSGASAESQGFFFDNGATPAVVDSSATVSATGSANSFGVLDVASSSVLFHLSVDSNGGSYSQAFYACCGAAGSIRDSVGTASGATVENHGIAIFNSSPTLERVNGVANGAATNNLGLLIFGASSPIVRGVTCRGLGATGNNWGCLANGGSQPDMSDVAAEASGGVQARAVEYDSLGARASLSRVRAVASGGTGETTGVKINNCSPPVVEVDASVTGGGTAFVLGLNLATGSPRVSHVTARASSTTTADTAGVWIQGGVPSLSHVTASASGNGHTWGIGVPSSSGVVTVDDATLNASSSNQAVALYAEGSGVFTNITGFAQGSGTNAVGFFNNPVLVRLANARLQTQDGSYSVGAEVAGTAGTVTVDRSTLSGAGFSMVDFSSVVHIAESQLEGTSSNNGGTLTCLRAYDSAYAGLNNVCQ